MKLLVNDKEIALYLNSLLDPTVCIKDIQLKEHRTAEAIGWALHRKNKDGQIPGKFNDKVIEKVTTGVRLDLSEYVDNIKLALDQRNRSYQKNLHKHIDFLLEKFGESRVLNEYKKSSKEYFIKSVGLALDPNSKMIRRKYNRREC